MSSWVFHPFYFFCQIIGSKMRGYLWDFTLMGSIAFREQYLICLCDSLFNTHIVHTSGIGTLLLCTRLTTHNI